MAQDVGSAQETIACAGEGEDVEIAFNYAYLLDGLAAVGTDEVFLEVQSSLAGHLQGSRAGELPVPRHAGAHRLGASAPSAPCTCVSNA